MVRPVLPEVSVDLHFLHIQDEAVTAAPIHQLLHLLSVVLVVGISDEAHNRGVVYRLHDVIAFEIWDPKQQQFGTKQPGWL